MTSEQLTGRALAQVIATSTGGVGTHVRGLVPTLVEAGADVRVHGPQATEDLFGFTTAGARFAPVEIASGPRPLEDLRAARRLRAVTSDAKLIHAHGLRAATVAALANLGRRTPLAVTLHNTVDTANPVLRKVYGAVEHFVARSADVVIGASMDLVERARDVGGRYVVFGPVGAPPLPPAAKSREQVRRELGVTDDRPLLLCVGRLHPQKGYDTLIPASVKWRERADRPITMIAGDGPLMGALHDQIDELGAPVKLLGRRSDVADLMGAADLVLLPSVWEARSLVAQEAMRAGVALVSTTAGGMDELVGDAAYRIDVGDVDGLAAAVNDLLDHPDARRALAVAGARRAQDFPSERDTALALVQLYQELLGTTSGPVRHP
ncbi:glycosyltransferase involved in cell wall biosynthesis [Antricoccus suffuscus]|uniref:Glycosyltransferase involved in cell wall biosynthesis n=1 Tax=Antricoccus suffuscus TaxID=1629062 RepID=A0A2T0ZXY0_9ACTN|nr:glycosyltransferase family 4 protein [Antricoccus suffuscus]PRZ40938.1 glycosyltransferase involved in cell wall biosynthesis [Antricoccus suffuscus]